MGGPSLTPWFVMDRYAQREGMTQREFRRFVRLIRELDIEVLDHYNRENEKRERRAKSKQKSAK